MLRGVTFLETENLWEWCTYCTNALILIISRVSADDLRFTATSSLCSWRSKSGVFNHGPPRRRVLCGPGRLFHKIQCVMNIEIWVTIHYMTTGKNLLLIIKFLTSSTRVRHRAGSRDEMRLSPYIASQWISRCAETGETLRKRYSYPVSSTTKPTWSDRHTNSGPQRWEANA